MLLIDGIKACRYRRRDEERVVPTTAAALRKYFPNSRQRWAVTFEEGPLAQWVFEILNGRVGSVVVCNPRYNLLVAAGTKTDRIDASKLAELLRLGAVKPVLHARQRIALRDLVKHYDTFVTDRCARDGPHPGDVYRGLGIAAEANSMYSTRGRRYWLARVKNNTARRRLEALYVLCDTVTRLRDEARILLVVEASRYPAYNLVRTIPYVGEVRAAQLLALIGTRDYPTRRHLVSYAGFAVVIRTSGEHSRPGRKPGSRTQMTRGLTRNFNPRLKRVLKDIALAASIGRGPLRTIFDAYIARGLAVAVARIALARRIACFALAMVRERVPFDAARLQPR